MSTLELTQIAMFWAGVSFAGNIVAATAKFEARQIQRSILLRVGHHQFRWLGRLELALVALVSVWGFALKEAFALSLAAAIVLTLGQQLVLRRSLAPKGLQSGIARRSVHGLYVACELAKLTCLLFYVLH